MATVLDVADTYPKAITDPVTVDPQSRSEPDVDHTQLSLDDFAAPVPNGGSAPVEGPQSSVEYINGVNSQDAAPGTTKLASMADPVNNSAPDAAQTETAPPVSRTLDSATHVASDLAQPSPRALMPAEAGSTSTTESITRKPEPSTSVATDEPSLQVHVQAARNQLADYDPSIMASGKGLNARNLDDFIDNLRLRVMARKGTRQDQIFKRGEKFVIGWFEFAGVLKIRETYIQDCTDVLMTFCKLLLKQAVQGVNVLLEKILTELQLVGVALLDELSKTKSQILATGLVTQIAIDMIKVLLDMICELLPYLKISGSDSRNLNLLTIALSKFRGKWSHLHSDFKQEVWRQEIASGDHRNDGITIEVITDWLASKEPGTGSSTSNSSVAAHEDLNMQWVRDVTTTFMGSEKNMLVITGGPGVGKSGLMPSIVEYLKHSSSSAFVLSSNVEPMSRAHRSHLSLVKLLILQLLDRGIGNISLFKSVRDAYIEIEQEKKTLNPEVLLWTIFSEYMQSQTDNIFVTIDDLDKIDGELAVASQVRENLLQIGRRNSRLKSIILCRPIFEDYPESCQHFEIRPELIRDDLHAYLEKKIKQSAKLQFLTQQDTATILKLFKDRTFATVLEVNLFVSWLETYNSYAEMSGGLTNIPTTLDGLVDILILRADLRSGINLALLSWLIVAERLMTAGELLSLLAANVKLPQEAQTDPAMYFQKLCPTLLEIRGPHIQFVHPIVKQRFLEVADGMRIIMRVSNAHATALVSCVAYIKSSMGGTTDFYPTLDEPKDMSDGVPITELKARLKNDALLQYCVRYYMSHYQKSNLAGEDLRAKLSGYYVDSVNLVIWERLLWQVQEDVSAFENMHDRVVQLRTTILGRSSRSVVQTLIFLAMTRLQNDRTEMALRAIIEAWEISRSLPSDMGQSQRMLAEKCFSIYKEKVIQDSEVLLAYEHVLRYLWDADGKVRGLTDLNTLQWATSLKALLTRQGKLQRVAEVLKQLYDDFANQSKHLDVRAIDYADELIELYSQLKETSKVRILCEDILEKMGNEIKPWDGRRIKIVLRLADYYESSNQKSRAEELLRESWKGLILEAGNSSGKAPPNTAIFALLSMITTRLFKVLGPSAAPDEIDTVIGRTWSVLQAQVASNPEIRKQTRMLAQVGLDSGHYNLVLPILETLMNVYLDNLATESDEAVRTALALVDCYEKSGQDSPKMEGIFQNLLGLFLTKNIQEKACIDLAMHLIRFYLPSNKYKEASDVSRNVLSMFWRDVIDAVGVPGTAPKLFRNKTLRLALMYADVVSHEDANDKAPRIYEFIWRCCRTSASQKDPIPLEDPIVFEVAEKYTTYLRSAKRANEAVTIWQDLRRDCRTNFGAQHILTKKATEQLLSLYDDPDLVKSEQILKDIIMESSGANGSLANQPTLGAILALIKLYEDLAKINEAKTWYENLWGAVKSYYERPDVNIEDDTIYTVYEGYRSFLERRKDDQLVISITKDLRDLFLRQNELLNSWTIKATLALAKLWSDNKFTYKQAVGLLESVCGLRADLSPDREAILVGIQDARLLLGQLYAKYEEYAGKAESALQNAWDHCGRTDGMCNSKTVTCFDALMDYYQKQNTPKDLESALIRLDDYIVAILKEEHNERNLYNMAEYISGVYLKLNSADKCRLILQEMRSEYLMLDGVSISKPRLKTSGADFVDRRCFVFIVTVEMLLRGKPKEGLFCNVIEVLFTETSLYEAWYQTNNRTNTFHARFTSGARLLVFLENQQRRDESRKIREQLRDLFNRNLSNGSTGNEAKASSAVKNLFDVSIAELSKPVASIALIDAMCEACVELWQSASYDSCLTLLQWTSSVVARQASLDRKALIRISFKLAKIVIVSSTNSEQSAASVTEEIRKVIHDIVSFAIQLGGGDSRDFLDLSPVEINILIQVLAKQNKFNDLEQFFSALWKARTMRDWSPRLTIEFGKRLCFTQYQNTKLDDSLLLIEDICYNVRDTLGAAHAWTAECDSIRAQILGSKGSYIEAMKVRATTLTNLVESSSAGDKKFTPEAAAQVIENLRGLRAAYQLAKPRGNSESEYSTLAKGAGQRIAPADSVSDLASLTDVSTWPIAAGASASASAIQEAKSIAHWTGPSDWSLPQEAIAAV